MDRQTDKAYLTIIVITCNTNKQSVVVNIAT